MAQSIKLGNNTYLDASGVAVNNSGGTLQFTTISTSSITAKGGWTIESGYADKFGRMVYVRLHIQNGTWASGWNNFAQMPSGFASYRANTLLCGLDNNSDEYFQARIDADGIVRGYKKTGLSNDIWIFGSYSTD